MSEEARRIAELEEDLQQARSEIDRYRSYLHTLSRDIPSEFDDAPPTEEEAQRMMAAPPGPPLADVIAELRRTLP